MGTDPKRVRHYLATLLERDARNANIKLDYDADRIAENFTLVHWDANSYHYDQVPRTIPEGQKDPFAGWTLRTAISLFSPN